MRCVLCGLILFGVVALPPARAADDPAQAGAEWAFDLQVVGPDGQPIPQATVEIRTRPSPTSKQIRLGTFQKLAVYGTFAATDAQGRLGATLPKAPTVFNVNITTAGYAPYWAGWSSENHAEPIPPRFTAELDAGWSVGGIVVDAAGRPVAGVKFAPSIRFKKRPGDSMELYVGTNLKTDATGVWRFDSVPASEKEVYVRFSHADFKPEGRRLARSEFGIEPGQQPVSNISLDPGLTVVGQVTDDGGRPIQGARVFTKLLNDIREAKTDREGKYRLAGCEPRTARIVVSAKGRATDMKEVRIDDQTGQVDFEMKPGGTVRIRVVDEQDKPIPKVRIFFQRWRGAFEYFEFDHVSQYADKNGVWTWNEAPLDSFEADICRPGGMELGKQSLIAREEEYVFRPPPALVISGKVIDAKTKQPVKTFEVLPGVRWDNSQLSWTQGELFTATDGTYRLRRTHDYPAHMIQIQAGGYRPAVSRDIQSNEGDVSIDFELEKGTDAAAIVLSPDGTPAQGAKVALGVAGSQIHVANGQVDFGGTYAARQQTDSSGQFRFPPQAADFQLVIVHPSGFAHVRARPDEIPATIDLEAWAKVEGTFRVGKSPGSNVPITLNTAGLHSSGKDVPNIFTTYDTTTAGDGRFTFERVVPGSARIGRRIMLTVRDGAVDVASSCMMPEDFESGATSRIDLGGTGRAVVGKLKLPEDRDVKVNWSQALVNVEVNLPVPPKPPDPPIPNDVNADPEKRAAWLLEWEQTPPGQAWMAWTIAVKVNGQRREGSPRFTATIDRDGVFRIDDVPEGDYVLSLQFIGPVIARLRDYRFKVPSMEGDRSDEPLDLGVLTLE